MSEASTFEDQDVSQKDMQLLLPTQKFVHVWKAYNLAGEIEFSVGIRASYLTSYDVSNESLHRCHEYIVGHKIYKLSDISLRVCGEQ